MANWVAAYERAWRTPGTDALASIFTESAGYLQAPYAEPVIGLPAIAAMWEAERILAGEAVIVPLAYEPEHLMIKPWIVHYPSIPVTYPGFWKDIVVGPR